jgi:hypothetical protein
MAGLTKGVCLYCGTESDYLLGKFCSPVCDSQHQIYGSFKGKEKISRKCEECGKAYKIYQKRQRFCSPICRSRHFNKLHHKPCLRKECMICQPSIDHRPKIIQKPKKDLFA